jgi:Asp-tRNA(Asn)/Glu-tRNA(Gln) amidotransferase A subunit family amidase
MLAKSNMAEYAWSPFETVGSLLPGYTRNPYALDRVPAGSSGGTAAAVASNFGALRLGTDTGNSIRGPSSHTSLFGIRSTMGLTSRDGINTPHGNNSPRISPPTGFPAVTVPMGFVHGSMPAGLQILGRPWSEATLIKIPFAYEQATRHRRPPASTPMLMPDHP